MNADSEHTCMPCMQAELVPKLSELAEMLGGNLRVSFVLDREQQVL